MVFTMSISISNGQKYQRLKPIRLKQDNIQHVAPFKQLCGRTACIFVEEIFAKNKKITGGVWIYPQLCLQENPSYSEPSACGTSRKHKPDASEKFLDISHTEHFHSSCKFHDLVYPSYLYKDFL